MYSIELEWEVTTPLEWAELAQEAEKKEKWGDAFYYWLASSEANKRENERISKKA